MTDPIADMLTRIRNAYLANLSVTKCPSSKLRVAVLSVLKEEGYISDYSIEGEGVKSEITITLRYYNGSPAMREVKKLSKPGLRQYVKAGELVAKRFYNGLGVVILSTSKGVISDHKARQLNVGGEMLCCVF